MLRIHCLSAIFLTLFYACNSDQADTIAGGAALNDYKTNTALWDDMTSVVIIPVKASNQGPNSYTIDVGKAKGICTRFTKSNQYAYLCSQPSSDTDTALVIRSDNFLKLKGPAIKMVKIKGPAIEESGINASDLKLVAVNTETKNDMIAQSKEKSGAASPSLFSASAADSGNNHGVVKVTETEPARNVRPEDMKILKAVDDLGGVVYLNSVISDLSKTTSMFAALNDAAEDSDYLEVDLLDSLDENKDEVKLFYTLTIANEDESKKYMIALKNRSAPGPEKEMERSRQDGSRGSFTKYIAEFTLKGKDIIEMVQHGTLCSPSLVSGTENVVGSIRRGHCPSPSSIEQFEFVAKEKMKDEFLLQVNTAKKFEIEGVTTYGKSRLAQLVSDICTKPKGD